MDENKLAELFKDAVRDAPPPSFDAGDVRAASHRATVRQRSAVALGSTLAAVLVFGGVALGAGLFVNEANTTSSVASDLGGKAADQPAAPYGLGSAQASAERDGPRAQNVPESSSMQGVEPSGNVSPPADGTPTGCGTVDRELANALAGELSVAPDQARPADIACPSGSRSASFEVDGGRVFAVVVPGREALGTPLGAAKSSETTDRDGTLYVVSESPKFADKVGGIAANLRGRF
ncbi:hypothetical protein ACFFQW_28215 [Umezawaea endophytica]|uniref:Uncharacterized protein n=1 Tax=Umezawaea endophytica TaxID=1654476 RepID=A0A9X2VSQ0_9PSEU|nr:hypothetical protein [Umezawaea endophytica]MCS7480863.1 hypothetical protein [Umezawaea endophytica]